MAWLLLAPDRWLGSVVPTHTAGTAFNLGLLAELRVSLALLGLLCLALGLFPSALYRLADHLAAPLAAVDQWLRKGKRWSALLLACTAATAALFASYSIARHNAFNSKAYDLGLHAQVFLEHQPWPSLCQLDRGKQLPGRPRLTHHPAAGADLPALA